MRNFNLVRAFLAIRMIAFFVSVFAFMNAKAQDNNYWNLMPGSRSSVMGGAVVGGVRDNTAIFYNPGALGFVDSNTISVDASLYNYEHEVIKNGGGAGVDFKSPGVPLPVPLVQLSGMLRLKKKPKNTFGFMVFTKNETSNNFSYRTDGLKDTSILSGDGYTASKPNVDYIGEYNLKTSLNEIWVGLSYSYQINSHISIGVSPFFAYRVQTLSSSFTAETFADSTSNYFQLSKSYSSSASGTYLTNIPTWSYSDIENITFSNLRALGKIGIAFDYGNLKFGGAFTTPSVSLFGKAIIERDIAYNGNAIETNSEDNQGVVPTNVYLNYRSPGPPGELKTTFRSPYSASLGIDYTVKKTGTTIAITGEYFGALAPYALAQPAPTSFLRPSWYNTTSGAGYLGGISLGAVNSDEYLRIVEASKAVANFAIAIYQVVSRRIDIAASFRSDYTSYQKASNDIMEWAYVDQEYQQGLRLSFSNVDLYHVTLGVIIKNKKSDIYLGVNYTFGTNTSFQPMNDIANPGDQTNNLGALAANNGYNNYPNGIYTPLAKYIYSSYSLIVGYTHHFK